VISMRANGPIWAVATTGAHGVSALSISALSGALPTVTAGHISVRLRRLAWPQCGQRGSSVSTAAQPIARIAAFAGKAEAHQRFVDVNDGDLMRAGAVWGPDPWRPHPV
jgi:hypothetical protein